MKRIGILRGILRIPNHPDPNEQLIISWFVAHFKFPFQVSLLLLPHLYSCPTKTGGLEFRSHESLRNGEPFSASKAMSEGNARWRHIRLNVDVRRNVRTMGTHVSFIFWDYIPYIGGLKPSFFMGLGSKGIFSSCQRLDVRRNVKMPHEFKTSSDVRSYSDLYSVFR